MKTSVSIRGAGVAGLDAAERVRTVTGAASLILFFLVGLAGEVLVPHVAGDPATRLRMIAADPSGSVLDGWTEFAGAVLFLAGVLFLARATRGRGSGWGSAGVVTGILGAAGLGIIAMHSFVDAALAQTPIASAVATEQAMQAYAGWLIFPLMICQPVAVALFAVALWREGTVRQWVAASGAAVLVVSVLPVPAAGIISLAIGLVVAVAAVHGVLRERTAAPTLAHRSAFRTWAGASCVLALGVLNLVKRGAFPAEADPGSAIAAAAAHPEPQIVEAFMAIGIAVLYAGTVAFLAGSVRARGSGLAMAGTAFGVAGAMTIAGMSVLDFLTAAAGSAGAGAGVIDPLGGILFPALMPVLIGENLMPLFFAAALWRARVTSWVPFALALVFAVAGQFHLVGPLAFAQMVLAFTIVGWLAYRILRAEGVLPAVVRGGGRTTPAAAPRGALG